MKVYRRVGALFTGFVILLVLAQCASSSDGRKSKSKNVTKNRLGYMMPKYNFSVDGEYHAQTAGIIQGYTAVTFAVVNKGFNPVLFHPNKDRWRLKDRDGKWHKATTEIQFEEPEQWQRLNPKTQKILRYPETLTPGQTKVFKLFFLGKKNLAGFEAVEFYSAAWKKKFTFTRY